MVLAIVIIVFALLAAWIVRQAGWRFAAQRLGGAVAILLIVTFLTTWLLRQTPGDPCITALGTGATEETVAQCEEERGLNENVVVQWAKWGGDVLTGDLGYAFYKNQEPLTTTLQQRLPRSAWL